MKFKNKKIILSTSALMIILVTIVTGIITVYAIIGTNNRYSHKERYQCDLQTFDSEWIIKESKEKLLPVNGVAKISAQKDVPVTIVNIVPEQMYRNENILFRSSQQEIVVRIDNNIVYEYPPKASYTIGKIAPSSWNIIPVKSEYHGKEIEIEVTSRINMMVGYINEPAYGSYSDIRTWVSKTYGVQFIISLAIVFLGLTVLGLSLFMPSDYKKSMFYLSLFALSSGIWAMGESKLVEFLIGDPYMWKIFVFISLMFIPLMFSLFAQELLDVRNKRHTAILTSILEINIVLQIGLHGFEIMDFSQMVSLTHIGIVATVIVYGFNLFKTKQKFFKLNIHKKVSIFSACEVVVCSIMEMYAFYFGKLNMVGLFIRIGILLYLILLLIIITDLLMSMIDETVKLNKEITNYRVAIAMSQIKPHFIFNVLTSIRTLIKTKPDIAYDMIGYLSKYIRVNMSSMSNEQLIPFERELQHINTYVAIEKVRFGNRVNFMCMADDVDFYVPALCIQPLVENAIKHGVCKKMDGGTVMLRTFKAGQTHVIEIIDDGVGFDENGIDGKKNIGLSNVRFRLTALVNASMVIKSKIGSGTKIRIEILDSCSKKWIEEVDNERYFSR